MEQNGKWVTLKNGTHIFIKEGQTIEEAMKENFDSEELPYKKEFDDENWEEKKGLEKYEKIKPNNDKDAHDVLYNNYKEYKKLDEGRQSNCQKQGCCFELRMRGYDVLPSAYNPYYEEKDGKAVHKENGKNLGYTSFFNVNDKELTDLYHNPQTMSEYVGFYNCNFNGVTVPIKNHLKKFPNSRWLISVAWTVKTDDGRLRHLFNVVVDKDGNCKFIDTQREEKIDYHNTWLRLSKSRSKNNPGTTYLLRVDNREINEDLLDVYIKERGEKND